jgi:DNA-binding LacI/PurR family transcriptional regulator
MCHEDVIPGTYDENVFTRLFISLQGSFMGSSIKDVANHAGISIATVSRALNTPERVSPATLARVQQAVQALHYRPNAIGRQLRAVRTGLLGVILPSLANPVFGECMEGIDEAASAAGKRVLLMTTAYDRAKEDHAIATMLEQRVDGLILTVADASANPRLDELDGEGLPYVLVYNDAAGPTQAPSRCSVTVDNYAAAGDAVRALLAHGHKRIRMLSGTLAASDRAARRHAGYRDALQAAGIAAAPPVEVDFNADALQPQELAALLQAPRPTAIFCSNDRLALLAVRALREAGLDVPGDISVIGFDGLAMGQWLTPRLATVVQPHHRIGTEAAQALLRRIDGAALAPIVLPHQVLTGGTLAPVASNVVSIERYTPTSTVPINSPLIEGESQ